MRLLVEGFEGSERMTFSKYVKIKQLGDEENENIFAEPEDEIVIQEKIDGANFRFMIKDGKIIFGSRTRELIENDMQSKAWKNAINEIIIAFDRHSECQMAFKEGIYITENAALRTQWNMIGRICRRIWGLTYTTLRKRNTFHGEKQKRYSKRTVWNLCR